jgi:hypothetical protein
MRHEKHIAKLAATIAEPTLVELDAWETLPPLVVRFAMHYVRAFANVGSVGIQAAAPCFHIWLSTCQGRQFVYRVLRTVEVAS